MLHNNAINNSKKKKQEFIQGPQYLKKIQKKMDRQQVSAASHVLWIRRNLELIPKYADNTAGTVQWTGTPRAESSNPTVLPGENQAEIKKTMSAFPFTGSCTS